MAGKVMDRCSCGAPIYLDRPSCKKGHPVTPAQNKELSERKEKRELDQVNRKLDGENVDTTTGRHRPEPASAGAGVTG
jgi:hypothetical protein